MTTVATVASEATAIDNKLKTKQKHYAANVTHF